MTKDKLLGLLVKKLRGAATFALLGICGTAWSATEIALEPVVVGLKNPVFVTGARDGSGRMFILEKNVGEVRIFAGGKLLPKPFVSVRGRVSTRSEQGLLGLAFHPRYKENRRFFLYYTNNQNIGDSVLSEFQCSVNDPNVAYPRETVLLTQTQPYENHNGGSLEFGPDGMLYLALGDGGAANDPHNNAQNVNSLLGKILRIDVDKGKPYAIPPDNPFAGAKAGRDEIYALGLRNVWRFSFDRGGEHRLFAGDVGQNFREEIDIVTNGGNYGWRVMEGIKCFRPPVNCNQRGLVLPIIDYTHEQGHCSVTGGYVYRGELAPALVGQYIYADYCSGVICAAREMAGGRWEPREIFDAKFAISSFGEDDEGELYVVQFDPGTTPGAVHRVRAK